MALLMLGLLHSSIPALAEMNITVDSTNSSIIYSDDWEQLPGDLDFNGTHMLTSDLTGTAVFEFIGAYAVRDDGATPSQALRD